MSATSPAYVLASLAPVRPGLSLESADDTVYVGAYSNTDDPPWHVQAYKEIRADVLS